MWGQGCLPEAIWCGDRAVSEGHDVGTGLFTRGCSVRTGWSLRVCDMRTSVPTKGVQYQDKSVAQKEVWFVEGPASWGAED